MSGPEDLVLNGRAEVDVAKGVSSTYGCQNCCGDSFEYEACLPRILNDPSPGVRETALRYLTEAPWESASPILQQAAQNDPDPAVRQTARELLDGGKSR